MLEIFYTVLSQALLFVPLAFGISISFNILRATDMTIDGSFVLGAAVFGRLVTLGMSPLTASIIALASGAFAGMLTACIQRHDRVDPLLAGVLATFILSSLNLSIMGKPNINLLSQPTLVSSIFAYNDLLGWLLVALLVASICGIALTILKSRLGLLLRAFGDNPKFLKHRGINVEILRLSGFALTNLLAAAAGCLTAQTIGYADIGMGFGMTLTGIGAIILGQQLLSHLYQGRFFRLTGEFVACLMGVILYFLSLNLLLRLDVDPIYLKMMLGLLLIFFLRAARQAPVRGNAT